MYNVFYSTATLKIIAAAINTKQWYQYYTSALIYTCMTNCTIINLASDKTRNGKYSNRNGNRNGMEQKQTTILELASLIRVLKP